MTTPAPSYAHGTSTVALLGETIGSYFDRTVARCGERPALMSRQQGVRWNYRELSERVDAFAAGLIALGLKPGERIGIWSPNNAEWVVTQFATAKAGLILVNINPAYRLSELEYALNKVGCRALVTATSFKTQRLCRDDQYAGAGIAACHARTPGCGEAAFAACGDPDRAGDAAGHDPVRERLCKGRCGGARAAGGVGAKVLQFDEPINIQFTSGTTGLPKGATLTHHNILNNGYFLGQAMGYTEQDKVCIPVPLYHCFGMVIGNLACITHGAAMVCPGEGFDPLATLQAVAEERCTSLYGVPTMFIAEMEHPEFGKFDLTSLRTGMMAGSPCPIEVMRRCIRKMHLSEMTIGYGMTETSPVSTQTARDDPLERRVSTVGRAHPHVEMKIVDSRGPDRAAWHAGRVLHARLFGDARLLGR